jgi:hypothetical protein
MYAMKEVKKEGRKEERMLDEIREGTNKRIEGERQRSKYKKEMAHLGCKFPRLVTYCMNSLPLRFTR